MDVLEAIRSRRSMGRVRPERPPRQLVEQLLEAASWAPNHFMTQPWRFFVLTGRALEELGETMADALKARLAAAGQSTTEQQLAAERARPLRAPVVVVVAVEPSEEPRVVEQEEIAAAAAATQNLLLAAHALGLAAYWRTGDAAYDPAIRSYFGLSPRGRILGFIYVGYPDGEPPAPKPRDLASRTQWRGWG